MDTGKAGLWPGGFFKVYAGSGFGNSVSGDSGALVPVNTGTLFPESDEPSTGLLHATFAQFLSPKLGLLAGKIITLDASAGEFSGNFRTQFLNTGLTIPLSFVLVPISAYGGALGLLLVRQRRRTEALAELEAAARLASESARYGYVYAVALHETGAPAAAREALTRVLGRHPYDRERSAPR